jgi:hypothetical protein
MSFTTRSAGAFTDDFSRRIGASSSFLRHYDEAPILLNSQPQIWDIGADGERGKVPVPPILCVDGDGAAMEEWFAASASAA